MASSNSNGRKQQQPIDQGRKRRDASVTRQNVNNMNRNLPFVYLVETGVKCRDTSFWGGRYVDNAGN